MPGERKIPAAPRTSTVCEGTHEVEAAQKALPLQSMRGRNYVSTPISMLVLLVFVSSAHAQRAERPVAPDGAAVAEFSRRVQAYVELRARLQTGAAELAESARPEDIAEAEQTLAVRIRGARPAAQRGDIFAPEVERRFRALLGPELRGTAGQNNRGIIWDEGPGPGAFTPRVNAAYPKDQPLATMPPTLLETLPALPEGIEYRFVGRHLILRDARANLIIDFVRNAIS